MNTDTDAKIGKPTMNKGEGSQKLDALRKDIACNDADNRRRARELGFEFKGNGMLLGTGNSTPQEAYNIRKYVMRYIIEHPELAKHGCFKQVWESKYGHIMPYINLTNLDIGKRDREELTQMLKDKGMYKKTSLMRIGQYVHLVKDWYEMNKLREERDEYKQQVDMLFSGNMVVINGTVFTKSDDYYIGTIRGKQVRKRKGIFDKILQLVEEL